MRITIKVTNYRCFPSHPPATFQIGAGVTAFVGENNAGKSAALRMLHDLRPLFEFVAKPAGVNQLLKAPTNVVGTGTEVRDHNEMLFNGGAKGFEVSVAAESPVGTVASLKAFPSRLKLACADGAWKATWEDSDGRLFLIDDAMKAYVHNVPGTFEGDAQSIMTALRHLSRVAYIPASRHLLSGDATHFDCPVGDRLIRQWDEYKNGLNKQKNALAESIESTLASLFSLKGVHLAPTLGVNTGAQFDISGQGKFRSDEVGTGLAQVFSALFVAATTQPSLVLIDEPEFSLHPTLQFRFLSELQRFASLGLVFSTHNLGLAMNAADRVYSVARHQGTRATGQRPWSTIDRLEESPELPAMLGALSYPSYGDAAKRHVLLVEGPTDLRVIQVIIQGMGIADRVVCMHMGGSTTLASVEHARIQLSGVKRLCARVWCLIDSEAAAEGGIKKDRTAFLALCKELGIHAHATERRATENYLGIDACRKVFGETASVPGPFEKVNAGIHGWSKAQAWQAVSGMDASELADVGAFLQALKHAVDK